jgi:hypothetical protein
MPKKIKRKNKRENKQKVIIVCTTGGWGWIASNAERKTKKMLLVLYGGWVYMLYFIDVDEHEDMWQNKGGERV